MATMIAKRLIKSCLNMAGYEIRRQGSFVATAPLGDVGHVSAGQSPVGDVVSPSEGLSERELMYEENVKCSLRQFVKYLDRWSIGVVLDVGGNAGQFGHELRDIGFKGRIVSFEPLSSAHNQLVENAARDPNWTVAPRAAIGASRGVTEINIAGNSYSSSLLPMLDKHLNGAPESAYQGRESCPVICLDDYLQEFMPGSESIGLKIDTQGYEDHVLRGVERQLDRVKVVVLEMSLLPLYANAPSAEQLHRWLTDHGFICVGLHPEWTDPYTEELLQVNGVFSRIRRSA